LKTVNYNVVAFDRSIAEMEMDDGMVRLERWRGRRRASWLSCLPGAIHRQRR
jgi:hypothetical protein